jgi:hypothetical protein
MSAPRRLLHALAAAVLAAAVPTVADAQSDPAQVSSSGLQISQVRSGLVAAPDIRVTEVNGKQATLAGGYLGWLTDKRLLIGGAGYVLANRADDFRMQYGGGLVRWTFFADRPVAISTGVFAGFGTATIARPYGDLFDLPTAPAASAPAGRGPNGRIRFGTSPSADTPVRIHDDFTMAEPQLNIVWSITPWMRLDAGAGYRFIGNADLTEQQLRGPSGSLALQFGGK